MKRSARWAPVFSRSWLADLGLLAPVLLAIHACLVFQYGQTDDLYYLMEITEAGQGWLHNPFNGMGRPLTGWLTILCFTHADDIPGLVWPRLWAALGSWLLAVRLRGLFARQGQSPTSAWLLAVGVTLLPGLVSWVGWTVCFPYPLAAWGAVVLGERLATSPGGRRAVEALVGLLGVLCLYQPAAGYFLVPALVVWLRRALPAAGPGRWQWWSPLPAAVLTTCLAHGVYLAGFKWAHQLLHFPSGRDAVVLALGDRLRALFAEVLPGLAGSWITIAWPALVVCLGWGVWLLLLWGLGRRLGAMRAGALFLGVGALIVLALATSILSKYGVFFYRVLAPAECLAMTFILLTAAHLLRPRWHLTGLAGLGIATVLGAAVMLREGIARPNEHEYRLVTAWLKTQPDPIPREVIIRQPAAGAGVVPWLLPYRHEYGTVSGDVPWGLNSLVVLGLREAGRLQRLERSPMVSILPEATEPMARGGWFLPMDTLQGVPPALAPKPLEHPRLGRLYPTHSTDGGWWYSPWLGMINIYYLDAQGQGSIYWLDHGWTRLGAGTGPVEWLEHPTLGWIRTSPSLFPNFWIERRQSWALFTDNGLRPLRFWIGKQPYRLPIRDF